MSPAPCRRTASRSRLLIRLRLTALPFLRETVSPRRGGAFVLPVEAPRQARKRRGLLFHGALPEIRSVCVKRHMVCWRAGRYEPALFAGSLIASVAGGRLRRETLAAACAACGENFAAADRRHARTETVTALANQFGRLIGAFHCHFRPVEAALVFNSVCWELGLSGLRNIHAPPETRPSVARLWSKRTVKSMPASLRLPNRRSRRCERNSAADHARRHQWFVNCSLPAAGQMRWGKDAPNRQNRLQGTNT
jgi:hypothetical protein